MVVEEEYADRHVVALRVLDPTTLPFWIQPSRLPDARSRVGGFHLSALQDRLEWPANTVGIASETFTSGCTTITSQVILSRTARLTDPATRPATQADPEGR